MTYPNPIAEALNRQMTAMPPEAPDPAGAEIAERLDARIAEVRDAVKGVDPLIDRTLVDLERRSVELDATLREARRVKHQEKIGVLPPRIAETVLAEQEKIREDVRGAVKAAEEAFRVGRERLIAEVLPPVGRTVESQVAQEDLRTVLARSEDPVEAVQTAFREAVAEGDEIAVRLVAGSWGRRQFLAKGGSEEAWQGLVTLFHQELAQRAQRSDPRSREARVWRTIVGRDLPQFLAAAGGRLLFKVDKIR